MSNPTLGTVFTAAGDGTSTFSTVTIITGVGTLTAGSLGAGFTLNLSLPTITGQLTVPNGGTGLATLTAHGILIGEGTSNVNEVVLGNTQLLVGQTSADPSAVTLSGDATLSNTGVLTLATVNSNVGTFGTGTTIPVVTVNAKGLITAISTTPLTISGAVTGSGWWHNTTGTLDAAAQGPLTASSVTDWYIDPVSGNDSNNGTSSGTAVKTWREVIARLGTTTPNFSVAVTFHILSSQTDLTDPLVLSPVNGTTTIVGTQTVVTTTTMSSVSYSAGNIVTATITGAVAGQMVVNTTRGNSVAWIDTVVGSVCTITVPCISGSPYTTIVTTWASGDTITLNTLPQVYASSIGTNTDNVGSSGVTLLNLNIGITGHSYVATATTGLVQCRVDTQYIANQSVFDSRGGEFVNCWIDNQLEIYGSFIVAGAIHNSLNSASAFIVVKTQISNGTLISGNGGLYLENAEVASLNVFCTANPNINLIGNNNFGVGAPSTIYGTYTLNVGAGTGDSLANLRYYGTAATTFFGTPTFTFGLASLAGATSFGNALDTQVDPTQLRPHRALTVANLDAAVTAGGFGGTAYSDFGSVITNATQGTAVPGNLTSTDWYIDPTSGLDSNTGLSSGSAFKTFARLYQALGPQPWVFTQATTIHVLTNHTSLTDPVHIDALFSNGGSLTISPSSTTAFTGTIATLTAKSIGNPGTLLAITATSWTPTKGQLVVNTTRGSCALVEAVSGSTATMCQPYTNIVVPAITGGSLDNTWAATDAITVLALGQVNIGYLKGRFIDHGTGFQSGIQIYRAQVIDPTFSGSQTTNLVTLDGKIFGLESWFTRTASIDYTGDGTVEFINTGLSNALYGGCDVSNKGNINFLIGGFVGPDMRVSGFEFTGGVIIEVSTGVLGLNGGVIGSDVYLYSSGGGFRIFGDVLVAGSSVFWGPGFVAVFGCNLTWVSGNTTATALFKCAAGTLDGVSYANAIDTLFDPAVLHPNRSLTAANIDATVASGGFNGRALGIAGGFIGATGATLPTASTYIAAVANGGTGLGTLTAHNVLLGEGTSNVAFSAPGAAGTLMVSQGAAADPTFVALSGDATLAGSGALTLATVNANTGTFGSTTQIGTFTVNGKGLITAASNVSLAAGGLPAITLTGDTTGSGSGGTIATTTVSLTGSAGTVNIATTGNILTWAAGTTAPGITQTAQGSVGTTPGATGATLSLTGQAGQATSAATGVGGIGALVNVTGGTGGAASGATTSTGGVGGGVSVSAGTGGASTAGAGTRTGGNGGNLTLSSGAGGTGTSANGAAGNVLLQAGGTTIAQVTPNQLQVLKGFQSNVTLTTLNTPFTVLATHYIIKVVANTANVTLTLPGTPSSGDTYVIKDAGGTSFAFPITISGNGNNIDGAASITINTNYAAVTLIYDSTTKWGVF